VTYLLDTNTCIAVLTKREPTLTARWKRARPHEIRLCSIVKAELRYGAEKSARRELALQKLAVFFARFRSLPFDDAAAQAYGSLRAELARQGRPIGPNDTLIAAIALAHDLVLVTHNTEEFRRVPGLAVEDWQV
jgi:tRNA(fMet)-specific endonuclease VapC